jgi:STAS domain-containing protein
MIHGKGLRPGGDLTVDAIGGLLAITLSGAIDVACAGDLRRCVDRAARAGRPVVIDLSDVAELSKEAVDALAAAHRRLGVRLSLVAARGGPAWSALRERGVAHLFAVHASRPRAMAASAPRGALGRGAQ